MKGHTALIGEPVEEVTLTMNVVEFLTIKLLAHAYLAGPPNLNGLRFKIEKGLNEAKDTLSPESQELWRVLRNHHAETGARHVETDMVTKTLGRKQ